MPTPFQSIAEELAPAPPATNFFRPGESAGVMARYAANRDRLATSMAPLEAVSRLEQSRWDRIARRRQAETWGREDEEYAARKDFQAKRGEFLSTIARLDETKPDFEDRLSEIMATLPEEALKDDGLRDMVGYKRGVAEDLRREKQQIAYQESIAERMQGATVEKAREKAAYYGAPLDAIEEAGDDPAALWMLAGAARRAREDEEAAAKAAEKARETGTQRRASLQKMLDNPRAFPRHTQLLLERAKAEGKGRENWVEKNLKDSPTYRAEYEKAKQWDSGSATSRLNRYLNAALNVATEDEWLRMIGGMTDFDREQRREFWRMAQETEEVPAGAPSPAAPAAAPVSAPPEPAPAPEPTKPVAPATKELTPEVATALVAEVLQGTGRTTPTDEDRAKARELARQRGYKF